MAVHSVGEIERQIPAEKFIVHGTYCNLCVTVDRLVCKGEARVVTSVMAIRGYNKTSTGSKQSFYGNSDFPITLF